MYAKHLFSGRYLSVFSTFLPNLLKTRLSLAGSTTCGIFITAGKMLPAVRSITCDSTCGNETIIYLRLPAVHLLYKCMKIQRLWLTAGNLPAVTCCSILSAKSQLPAVGYSLGIANLQVISRNTETLHLKNPLPSGSKLSIPVLHCTAMKNTKSKKSEYTRLRRKMRLAENPNYERDARQKLTEQKLAEQKLTEQKLTEQKFNADFPPEYGQVAVEKCLRAPWSVFLRKQRLLQEVEKCLYPPFRVLAGHQIPTACPGKRPEALRHAFPLISMC